MFHSILRTCILLAGKTCSLYVYPTIPVQNSKEAASHLLAVGRSRRQRLRTTSTQRPWMADRSLPEDLKKLEKMAAA